MRKAKACSEQNRNTRYKLIVKTPRAKLKHK